MPPELGVPITWHVTPRVLHVVPNLGFGGAPRGVLELVRAQREEQRIDARICSLSDATDVASEVSLPCEVRYLDYRFSFRDWAGARRCVRALRSAIHDWPPDVLHSHLVPADLITALARRGTPIPQVVHLRDTPPWFFSRRMLDIPRRVIANWAYHRPGVHFCAVSSAALQYHHRAFHVKGDRSAVVLNGVDLSDFVELPERKGSLGRLTIGAAGRFSPDKGFEVLLRAAAKLALQGVPIRVRLLGSGSGQVALERLAVELGLKEHLTIIAARGSLRTFLDSLDVFVIPSLRAEGLPRVLIESMAAGCPVIASRVAGVDEVLRQGENGTIVPPGDVDSLADALHRTFRDPTSHRQMADLARRNALERHSCERVAADVLEQYCRWFPSFGEVNSGATCA